MSVVPTEPGRTDPRPPERLEQIAADLARTHRVRPGKHRGHPLLPRLSDNATALIAAWRGLAQAAREGSPVSAAAEWLVENFQVVDDQLRGLAQDLPPGFYLELPKLTDASGYPRVYVLVREYLTRTERRFDPASLVRFVDAYQAVQPLTLGELWALAISLRLALVDDLRVAADSIVERRAARQEADRLADALLDPTRAASAIARLRGISSAPLENAFSVQLLLRLRDCDGSEIDGLVWLNERLIRQGTTPEEIVRTEHIRQVALVGPVRDCITSLRAIGTVDWADLVEGSSHVEALLRKGTVVADLDFATRDAYRHAVEDLARRSRYSETQIATLVAEKARDAPGPSDPGAFLLSPRRREIEREIGYSAPLSARLRSAALAHPALTYLSGVALFTGALIAAPLRGSYLAGVSPWALVGLGVLGIIPATELGANLLNGVVTRMFGPRRLPKMAFETGITAAHRTMVVVPAMLLDDDGVRELVDRLEVHFLANDDGDLRFAILSDFPDAATERVDGDEALLAFTQACLADLNGRHAEAPGGGPRFFLFHRRRLFNASEGCWMGWERKRGKLHELNRLLRGGDTNFLDVDPPTLAALDVRYVITLDSDTRLPRGSAKKLIGAMAHPLNRPVIDPKTRKVVRGYGLLQPRITATLPETGEGSLAQRVFCGTAGVDPYAFAVSDVYQDLFCEGSYVGKGIYDVDAFETALAGRIPENAALSHDLLEGTYVRAGLLSDVELFEGYPPHYSVHASRTRRWTRGDWQLLPWVFAGRDVDVLGRWKMFDNLRRSLAAPALLATLVAGWMGRVPFVWTWFVLAVMALPTLLPVLVDLLPARPGAPKANLVKGAGADLVNGVARIGITVSLLVEEAWDRLDAITRTFYRLATGRRLLEWTTAADARAGSQLALRPFYREMSRGIALTAAIVTLVALFAPQSLGIALVFAAAWVAAPAIAWGISVPRRSAARRPLDRERADQLRLIARRTWRYFETVVTPLDNHLPPDNLQEDPTRVIAHRTSPTNIGLYLLATAAARDMGWIGRNELADRFEATLATIERLERHRGHLFNWYDTVTLAPLPPRYISTVDSGNLAGHLLAVQQCCLEYAVAPLDRGVAGIADALALCRLAVSATVDDRRGGAVRVRQLREALDDIAALVDGHVDAGILADRVTDLVDTARALADDRDGSTWKEAWDWAVALQTTVASHARDAADDGIAARLAAIAARCGRLAAEMDWTVVFHPTKKLFSIGYNLDSGRLDLSCYDLLASEARLASFVAIAGGQIPTSHWFRLGRRMAPVGYGSALVSWSGSMFEYLMPELVMDAPEGSLLAETARLVVHRQIRYGADRGVPWGVSEAAYNVRDLHLTYQYSNFGVAGLGLKDGLADDLVIAPYATALAAMVDPRAAADNFRRLEGVGARGDLGFYESVDYTQARLPDNRSFVVVKAYMAHHQGMTLVALCNVLGGFPMRRRFHTIAVVKAAELLLQERTPRHAAAPMTHTEEATMHLHVRDAVPPVLREFHSPNDSVPATHRLSNGRYSVSVTSAGGGQSTCDALAVTRWREDQTLDRYGTFIYLRDVHDGRVWSAGYQPTAVTPDEYAARYYEHRVEIRRRDGSIGCQLDIVVCPEEDAELRQVTLVNHGSRPRHIELTSYMEVVLNTQGADAAHPAFSNLFVQTEFDTSSEALLAMRRPRSAGQPIRWAAHTSQVHGAIPEGVQFETDRARFLGRGHEPRDASAVFDGRPLSNTTGSVLDPIFSLRRRVTLLPGETVRVVFTTLVAASREAALARCDACRDINVFDRTVSAAWTHAQVQLRHLGIDAEEAHLFQRLGSRVQTVKSGLRAPREVLLRNEQGQSALWRFGISGDRPIVLGMVSSGEDRDLVRQLVNAQVYLRMKGLYIDLVLLNEQAQTYGQDLQAMLESLVRTSHLAGSGDPVHLIRADHVAPRDHDLLLATARVVVSPLNGSLAEQVTRLLGREPTALIQRATAPSQPRDEVPPPRLDLEFYNGLGGFADRGRAYVMLLGARQWTPMPWSNVIANDTFGFLVTECGGGYTWADNAHENQLTAWSNDPISDPPAEVIYVRDEANGEVWTATPLPIREDTPYVVKHGFGYTRFNHDSHGIALELVQTVAADDPVKISRLVVRNVSNRPRHLSVAAFVAWVLGPSRSESAPHVVTTWEKSGSIFAHNPWKSDFAPRVAFFDIGANPTSWTADRAEFIGRNGSLAAPIGLGRPIPGQMRSGAAVDPCAMLWRTLRLEPGQSAVVTVLLGEAPTVAAARALVEKYRIEPWERIIGLVSSRWTQMLETVQVKTPDRGMDVLLNGWLLYQTLSCRLWARAAFYQSSGAYGFRDQLQDVMAAVIARPDVAREQILRAAAHQFLEGDVQHWWHPPASKGVRTRFSDDRVWLPYVASHYIEVTGDAAILDAVVPFLAAPVLAPGAEDAYLEPRVSQETATLYEHAALALDISLAVGRHGLPLIGAGDWNDGMNRVGHAGEGESVWLAWFLIATLDKWAPVAESRGDVARANAWRVHAVALKTAVEAEAWDGDWYRRAYMDDGTPLGSASNVECRIDAIAQSWSVLSNAGDPDRARRAMASVDEHLVRRADGVVLLLTPPFDKTSLDPGYIKGYVPGVRENGGQYTHAAIWSLMAFAALGDGERAHELFAMINPIRHTSTPANVQRYKVEPYALAADVYGGSGHVGRGGWTWYTGAAAWMYRAGLESILGLRMRGDHLSLDPCIPKAWPEFSITLQLRDAADRVTRYEISVTNPDRVARGVVSLTLDGVAIVGPQVPIGRDGGVHRVVATLGVTSPRP